MINSQKFWKKITPWQSLLMGFILIIIAGTILLTLPIASSKGISQPFVDALFAASSAISTTGLTVVDIGSFYSLFGQIVILLIIQIGGLGYMVFIVLISYILGRRLSWGSRMTFSESLAGVPLSDVKRFAKAVVLFTFVFEFLGAAILSLYWMCEFPPLWSIYLGIFHSISGFCTAGFGLFSDNLISINRNVFINLTVDIICFAGAIGFFVLYDIHDLFIKIIKHVRPQRLSVHSKLALVVSITLMAIGTVIIFISEHWTQSSSLGHRLLSSAFQSISASTTTGFNTIDIGVMSKTSLFILIVLMFIGASPGGTGGGIKTTTFGLMIISIWALFKGKEDTNVFKRRISSETLKKAFVIGFFAIFLVVSVTLLLTFLEKASFLQILFEVTSAFGNVGLSMGITSNLSTVGKIVLSITMLIGRLGPLTIGFSLMGRPKPAAFKYAEADVLVG